MTDQLVAPFPYVGSKRRVVEPIWRALGPDVPQYIEPFAGSLAVLLARPGGAGKIETVNDISAAITNTWRAIQMQPENELDATARHRWLVEQLRGMDEKLAADPFWCDPQVAAWYVHGACTWLGTGFCSEAAKGWRQKPYMKSAGTGVCRAPADSRVRPQLTSEQGIHRQRPKHFAKPSVANDRGLSGCRTLRVARDGVAAPPILEWMLALSERLRHVRVLCGDWKRVLTPSVLGKGANVGGRKPVGIFMDGPYAQDLRDPNLYAHDQAVSTEVREWAIEHGGDPDLRIIVAGYSDEHEFPGTWTKYHWTGARGFASAENENRKKETLFLSPYCLPLNPPEERQMEMLF